MLYNRKELKTSTHNVIQPLVDVLVKAKVSANFFTTLGFLLNLAAAGVFVWGGAFAPENGLKYLGWGGVLVMLGGICDAFDGQIARTAGKAGRAGALYDSVVDRYSELLMFFGMGFFLIAHQNYYTAIAAFLALNGSLMVSYTRARAEGLGIDCQVGFMQRPERLTLLIAGAILGGFGEYIYLFSASIFIVAVLANITAVHRLLHAYRNA